MMYPTDTNKIDYGLFDKCMFADTMIRHDNVWYFYYGAGDMYVGLATARAAFSAGASSYELDEDEMKLTASTVALNKKYGDDKTDRIVKYVAEVYSIDGVKIAAVDKEMTIKHFTHLEGGKYSRGEEVFIEIDLSSIAASYDNYYVTTYIADALTGERLNNPSTYTVVGAITSHTAK